ncbi:MAG: GGDEF domain-containing protein [Treponema sp.]|nr:GGDEF domain-containing protein [Treponema sp.]
MNPLNQRRISDITFIIDKELNVKDGNRSFLNHLHKTDFDLNLSYILEDSDARNLKFYLENFDDSATQHNFIANIRPHENYISCIFTISRSDSFFKVVIAELSYSRSLLDRALLESREFTALLQNFDAYYFTYDGKKIILKNTKDLTIIASGSLEDFRAFFPNQFKLNFKHDDSRSQFDLMLEDIKNFISNKYYSFLQTNKKMVTVHTLKTSTRSSALIVGSVQMSQKSDVATNLYNEQKDGLTGLYNKKAITELAIKKINEDKTPCSLIIIDVDKFKECNDTYGHIFGDRVLVAVANCIQDAVKGAGMAGRIGGDEFLVILDRTSEDDIRNVTRNIRTGIQWNITNVEPGSIVTCSMGIAKFPLQAKDYNDLFALADKCLYIAKYRGRNCYIIYKPEIHDKILFENKQVDDRVASGQYFNDNSVAQLEILRAIDGIKKNKPETVENVLEKILNFFNINKITVYNEEFELAYMVAKDEDDKSECRSAHLNTNYFSYFNEFGFVHFDNTNVLGSIDGNHYEIYRSNGIASTIEVLCRGDNGKIKAFICYDLYRPARAFKNETVTLALVLANLITRKI